MANVTADYRRRVFEEQGSANCEAVARVGGFIRRRSRKGKGSANCESSCAGRRIYTLTIPNKVGISELRKQLRGSADLYADDPE